MAALSHSSAYQGGTIHPKSPIWQHYSQSACGAAAKQRSLADRQSSRSVSILQRHGPFPNTMVNGRRRRADHNHKACQNKDVPTPPAPAFENVTEIAISQPDESGRQDWNGHQKPQHESRVKVRDLAN